MYNIERTFLIYIYIHKAVTIYRTFLAAENEYHKDIVYNFYKRNIENAKDQETGYWIGTRSNRIMEIGSKTSSLMT